MPLPIQTLDPATTALLVIDVQAEFCSAAARGNAWTERTSADIAAIVPRFRAAGVAIYAIYSGHWGVGREDAAFHNFEPERRDDCIRKGQDTAFWNTRLEETLRRRGHTHLLACGFNLSACVRKTVQDATQRNFRATLLTDLTANDSQNPQAQTDIDWSLRDIRNRGVTLAGAHDILAGLAPSP